MRLSLKVKSVGGFVTPTALASIIGVFGWWGGDNTPRVTARRRGLHGFLTKRAVSIPAT